MSDQNSLRSGEAELLREKVGKLRRRTGRRGVFLLFLAMLDLIYGQSFLSLPTRSIVSNDTYQFLALIAPYPYWGLMWMAVGVVLPIFAFKVRDGIGFALAIFLKLLWGSLFLFAWVFAEVGRGYLSAAIWLAFAGVVAIVATWPDEWKATVTNGDAQ